MVGQEGNISSSRGHVFFALQYVSCILDVSSDDPEAMRWLLQYTSPCLCVLLETLNTSHRKLNFYEKEFCLTPRKMRRGKVQPVWSKNWNCSQTTASYLRNSDYYRGIWRIIRHLAIITANIDKMAGSGCLAVLLPCLVLPALRLTAKQGWGVLAA